MSLNIFSLHGKVALVTGAGQGLGRAMAVALAKAGANIAGLDRYRCYVTAEEIQEQGGSCYQVVCDLRETSVAGLNEIVARVVKEMGKIDILVNNAGIIRRAPAIDFSEKDWDDVLHINLKTIFFLSQAVARVMIPSGSGKIINIASMLSFQGGIIVPSYTASKSGVAGLTRALANEWACEKINVNAIAPGYMATDNTAELQKDYDRSLSIVSRIPAGRWGVPQDLMGAIIFLSSAASDYVNGAVIPVDGGWLSR
jgi:2-dehydro-3-deoxy-D-gluconate 5-dehydrogenase